MPSFISTAVLASTVFAASVLVPGQNVPPAPPAGAPPAVQKKPAYIEPAISAQEREALIDELRAKKLMIPVQGANPESLKGSFEQRRGERMHRAVDFIAPRNTPIYATDRGTIARLFTSVAGGLTIYQTDPSGRFVYYYAHLERYADGLAAGQKVEKGQLLGYVGTSGNADPNSPHLHFAIWHTTPDKVFNGIALDPYGVFTGSRQPSSLPQADIRKLLGTGGIWI